VLAVIKSISYDQTEIIKAILHLHVPAGRIDCDPTYSKGNFYKNTGIEPPRYKFDIETIEEVEFGDSRNLPLINESIDCMMFDPPFLATSGKSLKADNNSNKINKRFGVYSSEHELHQFYVDSLRESHRVLRKGGILIFKCQDKVSGGKQYFSHCFIKEQAEKAGFYPKDLFILLAKIRLVADWQLRNQKNARKFHSYFWVFEKSSRKINYTREVIT
jgi:SAM-dependent methyltransferase